MRRVPTRGDDPLIVRSFVAHEPISTADTSRSDVRGGECALYRFYDSHGDLLYVGISWNPGRRWDTHRRLSRWWKLAVRVEVDVYARERDALHAEVAWIRNARPTHNVRSAE